MSLYVFEIKKELRFVLIFTLINVLVLGLYLLGMYPVFIDNKESLMPMFENFPEAYLNIFGMDLESFFSYIGIINFAYVYIGILVSILGMSVGLSLFSRETRNKCADFLITKPISRSNIFKRKLIASITLTFISAVAFIIPALLIYAFSGSGDFRKYLLIILTIPLTQFIFLAIGIFLGVVLKKVKSVGKTATSVGILAFLISVIQGLTELAFLRAFSPLQYFSPRYIAKNGSLEVLYLLLAIFIIASLVSLAYIRFRKKEV